MKKQSFDWGIIVAIFIVVAFVTISILTLLGPAVGNVFSNVVVGLNGPVDMNNYEYNSEPLPTLVSAAAWDDEMVALRPVEAMIIKNGEMGLLVEDTHKAIDSVMGIAARYGGYVQSSEIQGEGERVSATLVITVRAADFESAFDALRDIAIEVQDERATGEEVTAEYVDLESRLRNLQATRIRLNHFMNDTKNVAEALDVSDELEKVEAEIEEVKGRMNYLSERAALSTIRLSLKMPAPTEPTPTPTPIPAAWALRPTIEKSVEVQIGLAQFLAESLTWLVIVIGPYAVIGAGAYYIVRLWMRRQKRSTP